jgi:hypothetical protein
LSRLAQRCVRRLRRFCGFPFSGPTTLRLAAAVTREDILGDEGVHRVRARSTGRNHGHATANGKTPGTVETPLKQNQ